jgi:hypothetical protein
MKNGIIALVLCAVVATGFFLFKLGEVNADPNKPSTEVFELLVCLNNNDKPLFQGLVTDIRMYDGVTSFTEESGLERLIAGGICIATRGTQQEFTAASVAAEAAAAAQGGGRVDDDTGADINSSEPVPE